MVADRRDAERTLAFAIRLRDHYPPHRTGPTRLQDQFLAQGQPGLKARRFDRRLRMEHGFTRPADRPNHIYVINWKTGTGSWEPLFDNEGKPLYRR